MPDTRGPRLLVTVKKAKNLASRVSFHTLCITPMPGQKQQVRPVYVMGWSLTCLVHGRLCKSILQAAFRYRLPL